MKSVVGVCLFFLPIFVLADQHETAGSPARSLSSQEVLALKAGKGMGMGKVAELNRYPGPRHVLELADELALSGQQLADTQELFAGHKKDSIALGNRIIAAEEALDVAFSEGSVQADSVKASLLEIGRLRAELRFVHIETHLAQREILSEAQVARYMEERAKTRGKHGHGKQGQGQHGKGKHGQQKKGEGKHGQGKMGQGKQEQYRHGKAASDVTDST